MRDGTYHAESRRPPGAGTPTSSWAMPSAASWIAHRGAWVIRFPAVNGTRAANAKTAAPAAQAAPCAARHASADRRGARRGAAAAATAAAMSSTPADRVPDAGEVAPVRPRVHDMKPVGDDAEAERDRADRDAEGDPGRRA